jgi:hypothetical protein
MSTLDATYQIIEQDIWDWINNFVTEKNDFYDFKFPPCPYARQAVLNKTVDVLAWHSGNVRAFIKQGAVQMRDTPSLTTRVMVFPPKTQLAWGLSDYVEQLNAELISDNVFLNTGVAKTTISQYPGSPSKEPYFIVIANSLAAVLSGAKALQHTDYYQNWPAEHYALVVERRERMANLYGKK